MHPRHTALFFLLTVAASAANCSSPASHVALVPHHRRINGTSKPSCVPHEREALLAFKQDITGDPARVLASWQGGQEDWCRWRGVRCSNRTGHITGLHLRNINADIDDDSLFDIWATALTGEISSSLLSFHHLQHLDLSMNNLSGPSGRMPDFLGLLNNLRYLNLSFMPFYGRMPPQLGNLSKLHYLDLSQTDFSIFRDAPSSLYSTDISWLSNLPLRYLSMDSVNLTTLDVDWVHVVNMIPSLKALLLPKCSLISANQSLPYLNLTDLEELSLSGNYFFNNPVASCWFWNLTSLRYLDLSATHVYGQIPDALGAMTSLQVLDFSSSFQIMDITTANIKNLCNLESLDLCSNSFNGDIKDLLPRCAPNKLKELNLGDNNLTGALPNWIGELSGLLVLDLYSNQFTGMVPSEISMLHSLLVLDLSRNQFTGMVPSEIGMLSNLTDMDLSYNMLTGVITHEHLASLTRLRRIDLSYNSLKIVIDPEWLPPFRLEYASFASCDMGPLFPIWLQSQVDIGLLDISRASIFDGLPDWFAITISNIRSLDISNNRINGTLPSNFGSQNLQYLNLASNYINGSIPQSICQLKDLTQLNLANNFFDGDLPLCFEQNRAQVLILRNNRLSGKFPTPLKKWTDLEVLDLAWNNFSGRLPMWIGDFDRLKIVELSHNKFTESIPATITGLKRLSYLNLAGNSISGPLPRALSSLSGMTKAGERSFYRERYFERYAPPPPLPPVNLSVITKGQERYYQDSQVYEMVSIDLSSNQLTGRIPKEIASLHGLINLNLSWNHLSGKIPDKMAVLQSLESLDLSENKLDGEIPQSLSNLTYLGYLDLSYNNFTGRIPSGGQLDTLYNENPLMYDGNSGLCGTLLKKNCSNSSAPKHGGHKQDGHDPKIMSFYTGLDFGSVFGLWVVFCIILFKKSWRIAYFCLFDKVYDKVYVFVVVTWERLARKTATHL